MFYYEDMSVKEIASILEVSDNTVKSRLNYGRKKVKELVLVWKRKAPNCTMLHRLPSLYICCTDLENPHLWKQPSWIPCRLRCTQHCSVLQLRHPQELAVERQRQHQRYIMHHKAASQHQKLQELPPAVQPDNAGLKVQQ